MRAKINGSRIFAKAFEFTVLAGIFSGVGYLINGMNGRGILDQTARDNSTITAPDGSVSSLFDGNTVQIRSGALIQTFSFSLNRVFTTANFGAHSVDEAKDFTTYEDKAVIESARAQGCAISKQLKQAFTDYDYGWFKTGSEYRIPGEQIAIADNYIANHCAKPAP